MPTIAIRPLRNRVEFLFQAVAPATADTLLSINKVTDGSADIAGTSKSVAAGKLLILTSVEFSLQAGAVAAAFGTLTLRSNPSGATVLGSQSFGRYDVGNTEALIGAARAIIVPLFDGVEFSGAQTLGISLAAQAVTNVVSICLRGYECVFPPTMR